MRFARRTLCRSLQEESKSSSSPNFFGERMYLAEKAHVRPFLLCMIIKLVQRLNVEDSQTHDPGRMHSTIRNVLLRAYAIWNNPHILWPCSDTLRSDLRIRETWGAFDDNFEHLLHWKSCSNTMWIEGLSKSDGIEWFGLAKVFKENAFTFQSQKVCFAHFQT